jgi:hypothetical protein
MAAATTAVLAGLQLASAYNDSISLGLQAEQEMVNGEINNRIAKIRAEDAKAQGAEKLSKFQRDAKRFQGTQKAAAAASGVDVNFGSAAQAQKETAMLLIEDENRIKNNTMLEAWGYKVQGENALLQAKYNSKSYQNKSKSTLLGGVLQAGVTGYSAYSRMVPTGDDFTGGGARSITQNMES